MWNHGALDDWSQQLGACRILKRLESTSEGVEKTEMSRLVCQIALDFISECVVGDVNDDLVWCGPFVADIR
jgi:hypothetical protein